MRYIYEPLNARSIMRQVIEHEQLNPGKRVAEVVLTRKEWLEFVDSEQMGQHYYHAPAVNMYSWKLRRPISLAISPNYYYPNIEETTLTVRVE